MNTLQFVNSKPASARKGRGREREGKGGWKGKELENQRKCLKSHIDWVYRVLPRKFCQSTGTKCESSEMPAFLLSGLFWV